MRCLFCTHNRVLQVAVTEAADVVALKAALALMTAERDAAKARADTAVEVRCGAHAAALRRQVRASLRFFAAADPGVPARDRGYGVVGAGLRIPRRRMPGLGARAGCGVGLRAVNKA